MVYTIEDMQGTFKIVSPEASTSRFSGDMAWVDSPWGEIELCGFKTPSFQFLGKEVNPGHYCGYVKLPEGHPWLILTNSVGDLDYDLVGEKASKNPLSNELLGGTRELTFANNEGWIGFDTAHFSDKTLDWTPERLLEMVLLWAAIVAEA